MATHDDRTVAETIPTSGGRAAQLATGALVGRYLITGVLGRGGMGVVYAAYDPNLDRRVALKLLHDAFRSEDLVHEAQALAKLDDPHVVTVFDAGELDGHGYVAMQLVDGEDLATALAARKPGAAQIIGWFVDAGRGLAAAHAAGLVHRDFKPSNVLIDKRGRVAVTDFGLARSVSANPEDSDVNPAAGTPAYMAPEQHGMEHATPASDQFAFCVALWEALFGRHPFISEPRETMSPFAIGHAIFDGTLIPPPRNAVPRGVVDALTRGLSRAPASRWPSMAALLDVLAPAPRRRAWPFVIGGIVAAGVGGTVVWAIAGPGDHDERPTCAAMASERARGVWSPATRDQIAERFTRSGRSYAANAAGQVASTLDRYVGTWRQLAADACTAEQSAALGELVARRRACLDTRLEAVRVLVGLLATEDRPEFVEHAQAMVSGLPTLADCTDSAALLAGPGVVPDELADKVVPLRVELAAATARSDGGDFETARRMLALVAGRAEAIGWAPLTAQAHYVFGLLQIRMILPARDELLRAAELATANHLDRLAVDSWTSAMLAAATDRSPEAVATLLRVARGMAARIGDPGLKIDVDLDYGRSLERLGEWKQATEVCRGGLVAAQARLAGDQVMAAQDCLFEALQPQAAYAELEPMVAELIADRSKRFGADHPVIADYLAVQVAIDQIHGKLAEARVAAQRGLDIRRRAFSPRHGKIAESLEILAELAEAEARPAEARKLYEEALAIALEAKPEPITLLDTIQVALAVMADTDHDHPAALAHFEQAIALTRARLGPDSTQLAILLLNYGQSKAKDNLDAGIGVLGEGVAILERAHDPRTALAGASLGLVLVEHRRFAEAIKPLENALAQPSGNMYPEGAAEMKFALARALVETHGDRQRARALAVDAKVDLAKAGPGSAGMIKTIDGWLAQHP